MMKRMTFIKSSICLLCLNSVFLINISAQTSQLTSTEITQLPDFLTPTRYLLELTTDLDAGTFEGKVTIDIKCLETTKEIVLFSKELAIKEPDVLLNLLENDKPTKKIAIQPQINGKQTDLYKISISEDLVKNSLYQLQIPYSGKLRNDSQGYYTNSYTDENDQQKLMALTLFLPNAARYVLPCFDDPHFKATIIIKLTHAPNLKATSNMPLAETKKTQNDWVEETFEETPLLPMYVVAFMLSELEISTLSGDSTPIPINILVKKEFSNQVEFAKVVTSKILEFLGKYFGLEYPNKKLDIGVIPGFPIAGMENFGFINVSESPILLIEESASIFNKYDAATIIGITTANQWLGDIVSIKWWTSLFLVEAFGDYFSIIAIDNIFPDWKSRDLAFLRKFMNAIEEDSLNTSHPVSVPINDPQEINTLYDTITYEKGAYLILTINLILGEENFQKSLAAYVEKYKFSNAELDDLWTIMTEIAHANKKIPETLTMNTIMVSWLEQAGYPKLQVDIDYQAKKIIISQERFIKSLTDEAAVNSDEKKSCWKLPLSFSTNVALPPETPDHWFICEDPSKPVEIPIDITEANWIVFNSQMGVLCQINYDSNTWAAIQKALTNENELPKIGVLGTSRLIIDAFSFAWMGDIPYSTPLNLVQCLKIEKEYLPWRVSLRSFADLRELLLRTNILEPFQKYVITLLEPKYKEFGKITDLSPTDYLGTHFKTFVIFWACIYPIEDCPKQCLEIMDQWMKESEPDKTNPVPNDLKETVYCQGAQAKDPKYWNFLYDRYKNSKVPTELSKISAALACTLDTTMLQKYLDWSLDVKQIRKEESAWVFSSVCDNDVAFDIVKKFLINRFGDISKHHNGDGAILGVYISSFVTLIMKDEELTEFQTFLESVKDHLKNIDTNVIQSSIEKAKNNIGWQKKHIEEITKFFTS